MNIFYNGINIKTRKIMDCKGPILKKIPVEAKEIIEEMAQHTKEWPLLIID